ncbi:hypothetical protein [Streptobacillus moniliformis]|uniref:hypothetical protein n=1 Tax=Streptobacillus moniliformis TaxID=34105 RepID=UPI0007E30A45|nr:hypothetical protein [Streptobacillus moniliformis]
MKKILLPVIILLSLISFSAKRVNRTRPRTNRTYEVKRIKKEIKKEVKKEIKKEITIINNEKEVKKIEKVEKIEKTTVIRKKIIKPRYRLEGSFSTLPARSKDSKIAFSNSSSISFMPEWKLDVNKDIDVTIGPKISLSFGHSSNTNNEFTDISLVTGGEVDFNYRLNDKVKIYTGLELGIGVKYNITTNHKNNSGNGFYEIYLKTKPDYVTKLSLGTKINDKYNIAFFTGYGKGYFGIDVGYTF